MSEYKVPQIISYVSETENNKHTRIPSHAFIGTHTQAHTHACTHAHKHSNGANGLISTAIWSPCIDSHNHAHNNLFAHAHTCTQRPTFNFFTCYHEHTYEPRAPDTKQRAQTYPPMQVPAAAAAKTKNAKLCRLITRTGTIAEGKQSASSSTTMKAAESSSVAKRRSRCRKYRSATGPTTTMINIRKYCRKIL